MPPKVESEPNDFLRLRITNDAPNLHDRAAIRSIVNEIDKDISSIDHFITTLEDELSKLKAKRAALVDRRSDYSSLASPIRSLPMEILSEIFLYAVAESLSFRLTASHVCQLWRNAALATSELWSIIDEDCLSGPMHILQQYVQACVHRARSRPLTLVQKYRLGYSPREALSLTLEATRSCSWRVFGWYQQHVTPEYRILQEVFSSTSCNTLESLTIKDFDDSLGDDHSELTLDLTSFSTRLTKISFLDFSKINNIAAPWSQLTHLCIVCDVSDNKTILAILRQCSDLEVFDFLSNENDFVSSSTLPIHLSKLRTLHLCSNLSLLNTVTALVVTPLLQELILDTCFQHGVQAHLGQYLLASAKTLRRLWINDLSNSEIQEIIPQLGLLEQLTLVCVHTDLQEQSLLSLQAEISIPSNRFTHGSTGPSTNGNFPLPHLRSLIIACSIDTRIQESFARVVNSRWWPKDKSTQVRPVERLHYASLQTIQWEHMMPRNIASDVEKWKQQGLHVNILAGEGQYFCRKPSFILGPIDEWLEHNIESE